MFIAMNRFRIVRDAEEDFVKVWRERDSFLDEVAGFKSFALLRGPEVTEPEEDAHVLYASHSVWESREAFEDWTKSENFRRAHAQAGQTKGIYLGHPELELFEQVL
ncbi:MAG: antibiotic biosynthesis monooxygenase [Pseudomonadota bacterium]